MASLVRFRERIRELYRRAAPYDDGRRPTLADLAEAIGLSRAALSNRLNATKGAKLTPRDVHALVRVLAEWEVITTRAEASELLVMVGCPPFTAADWGAPPLDWLTAPTASALPEQPPPPPAVEAEVRHNLPRQLTSFIGREREIAELTHLLDKQRLVTLLGTGGSGKTRLSIELAARLLGKYRQVYFVALASVSDAALVVAAIAQTLGVKEVAGEPLRESLRRYLQGERILLILDNFEQVAEAAAQVSELLAAAPRLSALITSREALHIYGEQEYPLPPLALPALSHLPQSEALAEYEAVALFGARAKLVKPDFTLTNENGPLVAEICARLDGLPLAIELAAAWVRLFGVQSLLARLSSRLALLIGGPRDLPARQQTLKGAIDWSYQLLTAAEKRLFARLAVFVGGFTLVAACGVCSADTTPEADMETESRVALLVGKSMLRQLEGIAGEPRFAMLETIREYALEQLAASGEDEALKLGHINYYLTLTEEAAPKLKGEQQAVWLARLEQEHDNLRAALAFSLSQEDSQLGLRLATKLWRFWFTHGYLSEGRGWLEALLAKGEADPALRARALNDAGVLAWSQGDYPAAEAYHREALTIFQQLADKEGIATALNSMGLLAWGQADYGAARQLLSDSLALRRTLGDRWEAVIALNNLGLVTFEQGDYSAARALYEECLTIERELADKWSISAALSNLSSIALEQEDYEAAQGFAEESLLLSRELGDKRAIALALGILGHAAQVQGDYGVAKQRYEQSLALLREIGYSIGIVEVLTQRANVAYQQADFTLAEALHRESLIISKRANHKQWVPYSLEGLAAIAMARGEAERGAQLFGAADALREAINVALHATYRREYEQGMAQLSQLLDETTLARRWAEGRAMGLSAAIAYALELG